MIVFGRVTFSSLQSEVIEGQSLAAHVAVELSQGGRQLSPTDAQS